MIALALVVANQTNAVTDPSEQDRDSYEFNLRFEPASHQLHVDMRLRFTNREVLPLNDILLRTWAGAFESETTSPVATQELYEQFYPDGFSPGGIDITQALWNGKPTSTVFEDEARTQLLVEINPLAPGDQGELQILCSIHLPHSPGRFGHWEGTWRFGNALPIVALRTESDWLRTPYSPVGDPFTSQAADYLVRLAMPDGYDYVASAHLYRKAFALRDFSLIIMKEDLYSLRRVRVGDTLLTAWSTDSLQAGKLLEAAKDVLDFYERWLGNYPWEMLSVVELPFPMGGMEYQGLVMLTDAYAARDDEPSMTVTLAHELAHQWFYAMVGSNQFSEAWQDEALSEYATLQYVNKRFGPLAVEELREQKASAGSLPPSGPIQRFSSHDAYTAAVYGQGTDMLFAIEEQTGKMDAFLADYVRRFAYQSATREDFESSLNDYTGQDLRPLVHQYLDTTF